MYDQERKHLDYSNIDTKYRVMTELNISTPTMRRVGWWVTYEITTCG